MNIKDIIKDTLTKYTNKIKTICLNANDVVNNTSSTSSVLPIAADQGRLLSEQIVECADRLCNVGFLDMYLEYNKEYEFQFSSQSVAFIFTKIANSTSRVAGSAVVMSIDDIVRQPSIIGSGQIMATLSVSNNTLTIKPNNSNGINASFMVIYGSVVYKEEV